MSSDAPTTTAAASAPAAAQAPFAFRLDPAVFAKSIYEKVACRERVEPRRVYGFIKHQLGISYNGIARYENLPYQTELDQIAAYKDAWNRSAQCFVVAHVQAKHKWGRITPCKSVSLSVMHRPTRHALAQDHYVDLDMVNCQPQLLVEILGQHGIAAPMLARYAAEPKPYRARIMERHGCSKDVAKQLPISLLFGGAYDGWMKENHIREGAKLAEFQELQAEMKTVSEIVWAHNKETIYADLLRQDKRKWKNEEAAKRTVMALWCQSVERLVQEHCISWLVAHKGAKVADIVPCQDGLMLPKELHYEGVCADLTAAAQERFGLRVGWTVKPFDEAIDIPTWDGAKTFEEWRDAVSAKPLAETFLALHARHLARQDGRLYVFAEDASGGRWYDETDAKERHRLTIYISEDLYEHVKAQILEDVGLAGKERDKLLALLRGNTSHGACMRDVQTHVFSKVRTVEGLFNSRPYLFPFNNGVFELLTGEFRKYRYDDYQTLSCGWDWEAPDYSQEEHAATRDLLASVVQAIDDRADHLLFRLQTMASGLDARSYQFLHYWVGAGGNGKSLLLSLLASVLGRDLYYQAPPGLSAELSRPNSASPDAYNLKNKRWVNFTEVSGVVSVSVLRSLTGGGDITARLLNANPEKFRPTWTNSMEFNNPPTYDSKPQQADYRRAMLHNFPVCFTSATKYPERIGKTINGVVWKEANPYYESEEFKLRVRPYFFDMLAGIYRQYATEAAGMVLSVPASVVAETDAFIDEQNLFQKVFKAHYECVAWTPADWKHPDKPKMLKFKTFWDDFQGSQEFRALRTNGQRAEYSRNHCYAWLRETFETGTDKNTGDWVKGVEAKYREDDL